jgi:non-heme chloroperoxidase
MHMSTDTLRRSLLIAGVGGLAAACTARLPGEPNTASSPSSRDAEPQREGKNTMTTITTKDGTSLFYKDWGAGKPVVFSHGWPLSSDSWEAQMLHLAQHGFRCIAHDRRGHGRSSQPWSGNDMDTYADDLATVIDALGLQGVTLVGFSTGGGEVARYIGRHGNRRVAKAALISAIPPLITTPTVRHWKCSMACAPARSPIARSFTVTWRAGPSSASIVQRRRSLRA